MSLGSGFEHRTGIGSSALTPDPSSALKKAPQADVVRRTIITDARVCASRWRPGESRAVEARLGALPRRLRGYIEEAVDVAVAVEPREVRRGHVGGKD